MVFIHRYSQVLRNYALLMDVVMCSLVTHHYLLYGPPYHMLDLLGH